ncbi:VF530 family protein [Winogradskyella bathintestinalis]|uniref:VF530 family protein n=1 Tax=Winogradskyella bathintestinalis TaxID=3035208 RepID=A0ABT7ZZC8_9FLAO|nr:VF530 family protein [Winogradskyella bathintestinalis]MDN3494093.1 VF530 family protein [Winogradskyella bathintestinalis]
MSAQLNNPLHGIKLEQILNDLQAHYGWEYMGYQINIRCFTQDPSVKSSLKFLRRTPWARTKVEQMYLDYLKKNPKTK